MLNYSYMILKLKECFSPGLQYYAFAFKIVNGNKERTLIQLIIWLLTRRDHKGRTNSSRGCYGDAMTEHTAEIIELAGQIFGIYFPSNDQVMKPQLLKNQGTTWSCLLN